MWGGWRRLSVRARPNWSRTVDESVGNAWPPAMALKPEAARLCAWVGEVEARTASDAAASNARCMWLLLSKVRCGRDVNALVAGPLHQGCSLPRNLSCDRR